MGFTLLNPVHLLFINLITDCFPALALGMEKGEPDINTDGDNTTPVSYTHLPCHPDRAPRRDRR